MINPMIFLGSRGSEGRPSQAMDEERGTFDSENRTEAVYVLR
jgi:hypothetical protein